MRASCAFSILV